MGKLRFSSRHRTSAWLLRLTFIYFVILYSVPSFAKNDNDSTKDNRYREMPHYGHYVSASFNFFGYTGVSSLEYKDKTHAKYLWMKGYPNFGPSWQIDYYWLPRLSHRRGVTFGPGVRYSGFHSSGEDRFIADDIVWDSHQALTISYLAPQVIMKILSGPDRWSFNIQLGCGVTQSYFSGNRHPVADRYLKENFRTVKYGFSCNYSLGIELHINRRLSFITDFTDIYCIGLRHIMDNDAVPMHRDMKDSFLKWRNITFGLRYRF